MTAHAAATDDAAWMSESSSSSSTTSSSSETEETSPQKIITESSQEEQEQVSSPWIKSPSSSSSSRGLRVLFLSSDTGGGHRASAESLAGQFLRLYPGSEYLLLDIMTDHAPAPYNGLKGWYKHLSAHPTQWNIVYKVSNTTAYSRMQDVHLKLVSERAVRKRLLTLQPDVVVSVHPLMNALPVLSCRKISSKTGKHLPMFTVVTDLGSAHSSWFDKGVEKLFVASESIRALAKSRAKVPDSKLVQSGLPIRHDFAVQSQLLGDRWSEAGRTYQETVRASLKLEHMRTVLVMGGGEGCGLLSDICNALYVEFFTKGMDAQILVVCGRNEELRQELESRDWSLVLAESKKVVQQQKCAPTASLADYGCSVPVGGGCIEGGRVTNRLRKILSASSLAVDNPLALVGTVADSMCGAEDEDELPSRRNNMAAENNNIHHDDEGNYNDDDDLPQQNSLVSQHHAHVKVMGLGFVTQMAEYMVAADVLVSKAGPGTIAEAASLSLPVLLTSFLPGQEEGNVDFVVHGGFGAYCSDKDPAGIATTLSEWLLTSRTDEPSTNKLQTLSQAAKKMGKPHAAEEIARVIGESTLRWRDVNEERAAADAAAGITRNQAPSPEPKEGEEALYVETALLEEGEQQEFGQEVQQHEMMGQEVQQQEEEELF